MASRKIKIENKEDYNATIKKIDALMKKGEINLTSKEAGQLKSLAIAAQAYERSVYKIASSKH